MTESYLFVQDPADEIFNYKRSAILISASHINHNYDHRFIQINSYGRAASNVVVDIPDPSDGPPNICGYNIKDVIFY
jgi:hypothetical protein